MVEKKFKVVESDGHNQPTIHVFRDETQFLNWVRKEWDGNDELEEMIDNWVEDKYFDDPNMNHWEEYGGEYEIDHTKEV